MRFPPGLRKFVLLTHITTSVGWSGAVLAYLALDVTATAGQDVETVRAAYVAMWIMVTYVIVPLALASVLIGVINALGTTWVCSGTTGSWSSSCSRSSRRLCS